MAVDINMEKIMCGNIIEFGQSQVMIECKLPLTTKATKILCSNAKAYVDNYELSGNSCNYNGYSSFQVVYQDVDNQIGSLDYSLEFKNSFDLGQEFLGNLLIGANVVDVITSVSDDSIKMQAVVEVNFEGANNNDVNVVTSTNASDVYTKMTDFNYSTFSTSLSYTTDQTFDVKIDDTVDKILTVCPSVSILRVDSYDSYASVKAKLYVEICYLPENKNQPCTKCQCFDFEFDVAHTDIINDSKLKSLMYIDTQNVKITTQIDVDSAVVNLAMPFTYKAYVFNDNQIEIIDDIYSSENFTQVSMQNVNNVKAFDSFNFDEKVSGNGVIEENSPYIDQIIGACCNNAIIAKQGVNQGIFTLEGVAQTTVLYYNKEFDQTYSVVIEMPFMVSNDVSDIMDINSNTMLSIQEVNVKARRGKEIEVSAELYGYVDMYQSANDVVISNVVIEEAYPQDPCALSIYFVKQNETLWEVAKQLRVSPQLIIEQNPQVSEQLEQGQKIVVYKQKMQNFE